MYDFICSHFSLFASVFFSIIFAKVSFSFFRHITSSDSFNVGEYDNSNEGEKETGCLWYFDKNGAVKRKRIK